MANAILIEPFAPVGAVTATGSVTMGAPEHAFNDHAGVVVELACNDGNAATLAIDLGGDTGFDTVMAFGVALLPEGSTIRVDWATSAQGRFTGAFSSAGGGVAYAGSAPMRAERGVGYWSSAALNLARYVRVHFTPPGPGASVQLARLVIGRRTRLERNFSFGGAFGVRDLGTLDFSARGVLLRRRAKKLRTVGLTFANVRRDEVEATVAPLIERVGNTECIALLTDPDAHAERQNRAYFGPLVGDLANVQRMAAAWEVKVNLVSLF